MHSVQVLALAFHRRIVLGLWAAIDSRAVAAIRSTLPVRARSLLHGVRRWMHGVPLRLVLDRQFGAPAQTQVVVFGGFANNWIPRLAEPVTWEEMGDVNEVQFLKAGADLRSLPRILPPGRRVVIPLSEDDIIACPPELETLMPSIASVEILRDKRRFVAHAASCGLGALVPRTYRGPDEVVLPCVVKPARGAFGIGVRLLRNRAELDLFVTQERPTQGDWLYQEYIEGDQEYVLHAVFDRGHLLWCCALSYDYIGTDRIRRGTTFALMAEVEPLPSVIDAVTRLLQPLAYSGPCCANYKLTPSRRMAIFEINPRFGGSLMLARNRPKLVAALRWIVERARSDGTLPRAS